MSTAASMSGIQQSLSRFWEERNRRERNMLVAAAIVIGLALFYLLLINPALSGSRSLNKSLPTLRQQVAEVQALAGEAKTLTGKAATVAPVVTRESLEASLARSGLKAQNVGVSGESARVQFAAASFAAIVDWLSEMQNSARLSVVEANVEALTPADQVNASFTLRQPKEERAQ